MNNNLLGNAKLDYQVTYNWLVELIRINKYKGWDAFTSSFANPRQGYVVNYYYYCRLTSIPKEICKLSNIRNLYFEDNEIYYLPKELGRLTNLDSLDLSHNNIKYIPKEIGKLVNLTRLDLSCNKIKGVSKAFCKLNLKRLNLFKSGIKTGPIIKRQLSSYTHSSMGDNSLVISKVNNKIFLVIK